MSAATDTQTAQILIIDDDSSTCKIIASMLAEAGYNAVWANDSQNALRILREQPVKLVLLDIRLPGSDGIGILKALKKNPKFHGIPVIMVSAVRDTATIQSCLKLGANDFVLKPFSLAILLEKIKKALGPATNTHGAL